MRKIADERGDESAHQICVVLLRNIVASYVINSLTNPVAKKGEDIEDATNRCFFMGSADLQKILKYPHLFRKLEWWEFREQDLTLMTSFDFAKVVIYVGYWRVDDIVPIHSYEIQQTRPAKLIGFYLGEHRQHLHAIDKVVPAALSEYKQWLIDNKRLDKRVYSEIK